MNYNNQAPLKVVHPLGTSKPQPIQQQYRYITLPYDTRK